MGPKPASSPSYQAFASCSDASGKARFNPSSAGCGQSPQSASARLRPSFRSSSHCPAAWPMSGPTCTSSTTAQWRIHCTVRPVVAMVSIVWPSRVTTRAAWLQKGTKCVRTETRAGRTKLL